MKRKLSFEKPYMEEYIDTTKLSLGLQYLRSNHPSYTNVKPLIMSLQDALNEEKPPHLRNQDHFTLKVANWVTEETLNVSIHKNNDFEDTGIQTMSLDDALTEEIQRFRHLEVESHCQQELEAMKEKHSQEISQLRQEAFTELKIAVEKTKSQQWCRYCWKEAEFYCCWNTSYCSEDCQEKDWKKHFPSCKKNISDSDEMSNADETINQDQDQEDGKNLLEHFLTPLLECNLGQQNGESEDSGIFISDSEEKGEKRSQQEKSRRMSSFTEKQKCILNEHFFSLYPLSVFS